MTSETGLGCGSWWSDPEWERAASPEQKRHFVLDKLHTFNRERFMDVTYDRMRERWAARAEQDDTTGDIRLPHETTGDLLQRQDMTDDLSFDSIIEDPHDFTAEEWLAVLDQMGGTTSEVRDVMIRLGFERWRRE